MICFPDENLLALALSRGVVPSAVRRAAAAVGRDPHDRLWVQPAVAWNAAACADLLCLGATVHETGAAALTEEVSCWHELLPLRQSATLPTLSAEALVLFELADPSRWPGLAGELRRLGRASSFHWGDDSCEGSVYVRVAGPPVATLLRARDVDPPYRAFVEQAPRVWVEVGCHQPLAEEILPPPGKRWLIRAPRHWSLVEDGPFTEELDVLPLPAAVSPYDNAVCQERFAVPLRLVPGGPDNAVELWVLHDDPLRQLALLAESMDDDVLGRLSVAIGECNGRQTAVLRAQGSRRAPPVLVLPDPVYRPFLKLPNLFLPAGRRLRPALRRDAVRQLLSPHPERVTWLEARADGSFLRADMPLAAFRPLHEAVLHALPAAPAPLLAWQPDPALEWESFACAPDDPIAGLRALTSGRSARENPLDRLWNWVRQALRPGSLPAETPAVAVTPSTPAPEPATARDRFAEAIHIFMEAPSAQTMALLEPLPRAEVSQRQQILEARFLQVGGPPDAAQRQALWPELAAAYASAGNAADAAVCWMNALWETPSASPLWWWGWFRAEAQGARWYEVASDLARALDARQVEPADARAVAAFGAWTAHADADASPGAVADLRRRVVADPNQMCQFLEAHETLLPARAAWLAWTALSRIAGGDVLSVARARDRLLERLYHRGLNVDHDLPSFLRFAGQGAPQRGQTIGEWLVHQRGAVHHWIEKLHARRPRDPAESNPHNLFTERYRGKLPPYGAAGEAQLTKAYADLVLAWGLARLGLASTSGRLFAEARDLLGDDDDVHIFLVAAYGHRVQQALEGKTDGHPLPAELLTKLRHMDPEHQRYKIDRLRQQSRVLEPCEKIDPYRGHVQRHYFDALHRKLASLAEITDRQLLGQEARRLLRDEAEAGTARAALPRVLATALELAPRVGEPFALELLGRVGSVLDALSETAEITPLLERALFVAAHFGQTAHVEQFVTRFEQLLDGRRGVRAAIAFESLAAQSFRGLRKLGRRDAIDRLLDQMGDCLLQGQPIRALRTRPGVNRAAVMRTLLHVAAGWFYGGDDAKALAVLDEARVLLFEGRLESKEQCALGRAYAASLGQAPLALALERMEELLGRLDRVHDRFSTNSHFSLSQLDVIEAIVVAVVNDDFALGPAVRRWLDEDEHLVRRRIHADLRALL